MDFPKKIYGFIQIKSVYRFKTKTGNNQGYLFKPLKREKEEELPLFIVSFKQAHKYSENVPAIIEFLEWNTEFPIGNILETFDTSNNGIYKLYLKNYNLYPERMKISNITSYDNDYSKFIEESDREEVFDVVSVDPLGCQDIDDAFTLMDDKIQIHITDIFQIIQYFNLYEILEKNIFSSIYLPLETIHMLPSQFLKLGSLLKDNLYKAMITLEIDLNEKTSRVFKSKGLIKRNLDYDSFKISSLKYPSLLHKLEVFYYHITKNYKSIEDSHDLIEVLMILYNVIIASYSSDLKISEENPRIYRNNLILDEIITDEANYLKCKSDLETSSDKSSDKPTNKTEFTELSPELLEIISETFSDNLENEEEPLKIILNKSKSSYSFQNKGHFSLSLSKYIQITSPLRRLNDILNQGFIFYNLELFDSSKLDNLNKNETLLKRLYRKISQYELATRLYRTGTFEIIDSYIISLEDKRVNLYLEKYKLFLNYYFDNLEETTELKEKIGQKLGQKIELKIFGIPNPENINQSLKINILV
jgi:exoribonuclease R